MKLRCLDHILQRGCDKVGHSLSAGPPGPAHGRRTRATRLPLLRQLHRGLRHGLVLLDAVFPAAAGGEDRQAGAAHERGGEERAGGRGRQAEWRRLRGSRRRSRRSRSAAGSVVVAASCVESARILLNSKSRHWPNGLGNSSGQVGRNLCDHLYGTTGYGYLPQLLGQPLVPRQRLREPDRLDAALAEPQESARGEVHSRLLDLSDRRLRRVPLVPRVSRGLRQLAQARARSATTRHPCRSTARSRRCPSPTNYVDIDPEVKDAYGIPVVRVHFQWGPNELLMWEHAKQATVDAITASGGKIWERGQRAQHARAGACTRRARCRMGDDPKQFVTNRFGQLHDATNLFVCDASVFLGCSDKTTTLSILAFSLRDQRARRGRAEARTDLERSLATARLLSDRAGSAAAPMKRLPASACPEAAATLLSSTGRVPPSIGPTSSRASGERSPLTGTRRAPDGFPAVSHTVWALGWTSLFTDVSSEMVASVLPLYLVLHLGMSPLAFGVVDGLYQGAAALVRVAAGILSDRWRRYKAIAVTGYALSAACRFFILLAGASWSSITAIIVADRIGKGIRTAPRDALISQRTESSQLATAFGVHRALDAAGAMFGPVVAFVLLAALPTSSICCSSPALPSRSSACSSSCCSCRRTARKTRISTPRRHHSPGR